MEKFPKREIFSIDVGHTNLMQPVRNELTEVFPKREIMSPTSKVGMAS